MKDKHKIIAAAFAGLCIVAITFVMAFNHSSIGFTSDNNTVKKEVLFLAKATDSEFWKSVCAGASVASAEYNLEMRFEGPENEEDYATQNNMIYSAIEDGVDAIVFSAVDYELNAEAIDKAAMAGIKIVAVDSEVDSKYVQYYIGTDNYEAGCMAGENALSMEEGQLNIGIVNFDSKTENGQSREKGFRDVVLEDERVNIVSSINVKSSTEDARIKTIEMLKQCPEINVIVTFNEWTSLGVGEAVDELNLGEDIHVIAFDSNVRSVGMLEEGIVDALVVQNPYAMGYLGIEKAFELLNDQHLPQEKVISTSSMLVTRENMYDEECQRVLFAFDEN